MKKDIITLDGHSGSGKTTQEVLLREKTGDRFITLHWCYLPLVDKYPIDEIKDHLRKAWQAHPDYHPDYCEPSLSFWIDVPFIIARKRWAKREGVPYEPQDWHSDYDKQIPKYLAKLKELLPNFHVIDGLQPPDMIHQEIMGVLEGSGLIYGEL